LLYVELQDSDSQKLLSTVPFLDVYIIAEKFGNNDFTVMLFLERRGAGNSGRLA